MHGRTVLKIGLVFPFIVIVLASAADMVFYMPDGPHGRPLMFPPFLIGYALFFPWSWRLLNKYDHYQQALTHLLLAPLVFGVVMSLSSVLYNIATHKPAADHLWHSLGMFWVLFAVIGFAYIVLVSAALGLLYATGLAREYVPNYAIKGTSA
jgi:hypothetical protein